MSSSNSSNFSWPYAAASVVAGLGAGYMLGVASSKWLLSGSGAAKPQETVRPPPQQQPSGNLVSALVELTAEVARLRQAMEAGGIITQFGSRRSIRGGSTADFVSAQGDNTESDEDFYDPNEPGEDGEGLTMATPNWAQLDEMGKMTLESQDTCVTLSEQIKAAMTEHPDNAGLLWRLSRALFHLSNHLEQNGDTEGQKKLIVEAREYAQQALDLDGNVWQAHQWYAISVGSLSKYEGTQKRIEMGYKYKEHIDQAISLNSEVPTLYHLRGRFCFEVAGVSWLEKKAAAALFGTPPESTYEEALESLMKAEELAPDQWKMNALMIAKCHIKLGDLPTAVEWLHKAYNLPTTSPEDHQSQKEVEELLTQNDPSFTDSTA